MSDSDSNTSNTPQQQINVVVNDKSRSNTVQLSDLAVHKGSDILGTVHRGGFPVLDAVKETDLVRVGQIEMPVRAALKAGYLVRNERNEIVSNDGSYTPATMRDTAEQGGTFADDALGYAASQLGSDDETAKHTLSEMLDFVTTAPAEIQERLNRQLKTPQWRAALDEIHLEWSAHQRNGQMQVELSADGKGFMRDAYTTLQAGGRDPTQTLFAMIDGTMDETTTAKVAESLGFKSAGDFSGAVAEQIAEYDSLLDAKLCQPAGVKLEDVISWSEAGNVSPQEHRAALLLMVQQNRLDGFAKILAKFQKANGGRSGDVKLPQGGEIKRRPDGTETVRLPGLPEMRVETAKRLGYLS
jgi:hypothetical protein